MQVIAGSSPAVPTQAWESDSRCRLEDQSEPCPRELEVDIWLSAWARMSTGDGKLCKLEMRVRFPPSPPPVCHAPGEKREVFAVHAS